MIRKTKKIISILLIIVLITGCWDQKLLKDIGIVSVIGVDVNEKKDVILTVALPVSTKGQNTQAESVIISANGVSTKNARERLANKVSETFDPSKSRVFLFGDQLSKNQGIFSVMDSYYRDSSGPIDANVAIVKGLAKDALSIYPAEKPLRSEYYHGLLNSSVESGLIKNENIQTTFSKMSTDGRDVLIPYLTLLKEEQRAKIIGLAMFDREMQTGELSPKESRMFLILNGNPSKKSTLTLKVHKNEKTKSSNYININVLHLKRKVNISEKAGQIQAEIVLNLKLGVKEYPKDHLNNRSRVQQLNKATQKELTKLSERVVTKMQKANCDGLAIGLRVKAFHNQTWKKLNWDKEYPQLPIKVVIHTEIIEHGVID